MTKNFKVKNKTENFQAKTNWKIQIKWIKLLIKTIFTQNLKKEKDNLQDHFNYIVF